MTAAAVGSVSAPESGLVHLSALLTALHAAAAAAPSACATSEKTSETWWDSKLPLVAQPELFL